MLQALFDQIWIRLIALPLVLSFMLAAALRAVGRTEHGPSLAGASIAIAFAWSAAAELGAPLFPPAASDNALFYLMGAALVLAVPFDLFAAPGEDAHRAPPIGRWRPARKPQFRAVRRLDRPADGIFRNRIGGNRDQHHGGDRVGKRHWKSRA